PSMGAFFQFSIDPGLTVAALNDPEADQAARDMATKRYVGFVQDVSIRAIVPTLNFNQAWILYKIVIIGHGPAERNEEEGIEPDMCLPILPATYHPSGRKPLAPQPPFPFDNCYSYSCMPLVSVRIKSERQSDKDAVML
ncbi:hypothetical protein BDN72DRAFT_747325, partial [Pluteus cervinus]